jgi:hypothetical protein
VQALSYCDEDFMLQLQGPHLDKAEEVTNPVYLNMAAAQLKLGDHAAAAHNATQVRADMLGKQRPGAVRCMRAGWMVRGRCMTGGMSMVFLMGPAVGGGQLT